AQPFASTANTATASAGIPRRAKSGSGIDSSGEQAALHGFAAWQAWPHASAGVNRQRPPAIAAAPRRTVREHAFHEDSGSSDSDIFPGVAIRMGFAAQPRSREPTGHWLLTREGSPASGRA